MYGLASFPKSKQLVLAVLYSWYQSALTFECFCTFFLCSCLAAFSWYPSACERGLVLSPINVKSVMKKFVLGCCIQSLNWCSSTIIANLTGLQLERSYQYKFFSNLLLNSTLKCTGLKIPINAHFHTVNLLISHKTFSFQKYLECAIHLETWLYMPVSVQQIFLL